MLTVGKVGAGNAGYYQSAVVAGVEDYYAGEGEAPGRWIGRADLVGAVAGGLATAVDAKLLLEAKCAPDGTKLGKTTVTERSVTAFDLTFSAPKSVSVLYALANPAVVAAVEDAHIAAVIQAVASVSPRIAYTRTGHAGAAVVDAEGVFGIRYRHRTSRALDPQLHDHVLISNAVRTVSDGEWRTLDARGIYRQAKAAGVEYQTHLRAGLRASLGVEFGDVDGNGQADIVGIDESVLIEFSTRGVDIETEVEAWVTAFFEREGRKPTSVEVGKAHKTITLATRTAKPTDAGLSTATLREGWRSRADGLVDVDEMLAAVLGNPPTPSPVVRPSVDDVLLAVETKFAQWSEPQLIEQIAARVTGPDPATIATTIEEVLVEAMASAGVVDLTPPAEPGDMLRASDGRPVEMPPSAVRYTTSRHLQREVDVVVWATSTDLRGHRAVPEVPGSMIGLDDAQVAAVRVMRDEPVSVICVVGPAGAGKTRMLSAAVEAWQAAGIVVFGVGPSATAAQQLETGAGVVADTLHKLVHEHTNNHPPGAKWDLPAGAVVIIDEAAMVDTRLLHQYSRLAQAKKWRTILVGDHRQLDAVDAGGMFSELVNNSDVVTVELDTLHRFEHAWEAAASLELRDGDAAAVDVYDRHGRIHGHTDQAAAIDAVADAALAGIVEGRDVLVMAPTNALVEELNTAITERLLDSGHLDPDQRINIDGHLFFPGQDVVTRANDRRLTYGTDNEEWVRNGDRWRVDSGRRDGLHLIHADTGSRVTVPADYVAAGNVEVDYASTINRAQGATVDEAHLLLGDRTNTKQPCVGTTRGRAANHIHTAPPAFDLDQHGPSGEVREWTPQRAVAAALARQPDDVSALERRRQLREFQSTPEPGIDNQGQTLIDDRDETAMQRAADVASRLRDFSIRRSQGLSR
jgi:conjugative relaxase-like TrwC/TraI family protein